MNFKVRKISKKPKNNWWKTALKKLKKKHFKIAGLFLIVFFTTLVVGQYKSTSIAPKIFNLSPLKADQFGHTNILVLGVAGFSQEGGHLSDSIMIASVNQKEKGISMVNLPRDLFVSSRIGDRKINEVYAAAQYKYGESVGLEITKEAVSKLTGIDIHYSTVIDFKLFSDLVDVIGGVEIFVPEAINDPFYPAANYQYQTFVVRTGLQNMDGETALKYARSRKTSSDYERAKRQQDLGIAIKSKIEKMGVLSNPIKIKELYGLFKKRINTDLSITEMLALAKKMQGIDYKNSINSVLNDDPNKKGGILYTPAKEFYGGQFVLLPRDKDEAQAFFHLAIENTQILKESAQISILNGSKQSGKALELSKKLRRLGLHVIETGNYDNDTALLNHKIRALSNKGAGTVSFLQEYLDIPMLENEINENPSEEDILDIEIILGVDKI